MKSIFRFAMLAAIAMMLALTPALTTRAQGTYCPKGLQQADCDLLTAAGQNKLTSFVMDYTAAFKTVGLPATTGDISLDVKGNGPLDISNVKAGSSMTDPAAVFKALVMQNTLSAKLTTKDQTQSGNFEFRIVNGVLYYMGDVATKGKWAQFDLSKNMPAMTSNPAAGMMDPKMIAQFVDLFGDAISGTAADGDTIDGVKTREITVSLDLDTLLKDLTSDKGIAVLKTIMAASGQKMTDAQLQQAVQQIKQALPLLEPTLKATKISIGWAIDADKKQYRGFSLTFSTDIDKTLASFMNATTDIKIDFSLVVTLSKLNEAVKVDAPATGGAVATAAATMAQ